MFRLLSMVSTVCDRNLPKEPYWSEISERYMLKLFRDYVFHQVDEFGRPILDLAHIVLNLNKVWDFYIFRTYLPHTANISYIK